MVKNKILTNPIWIGFLIISCYLLLWLIFKGYNQVTVHDHLDSIMADWVLIKSGKLFSSNLETIDQIMNGIPRSAFGSEFRMQILLYFLFGIKTSYILDFIFKTIVGYFGMYYLLTEIDKNSQNYEIIKISMAILFSILPVWELAGLSIAAQPIVVYCFLKIRKRQENWIHWAILLIVPFWSSYLLSFMFLLFFIFILLCYDFYQNIKLKREINWKFFFAFVLMNGIYIGIEYRMLLSVFFHFGFESHRVTFATAKYGFIESFQISLNNLMNGQYHVETLQKYIIFPISIACFILIIGKYADNEEIRLYDVKKYDTKDKLFLLTFFVIIAISFWYGFWNSTIWNPIKNLFPILNQIKLGRFHWLHPLFWYILFYIDLTLLKTLFSFEKYQNLIRKLPMRKISSKFKIKTLIISFLIFTQLSYILYNQTWINHNKLDAAMNKPVSFEDFYSKELFLNISTYINQSKASYKIGCIGFHPAIAIYNRFFTIDGYMSNYPLNYKIRFRYLITHELAKNQELAESYDNSGSRVYILVDELGNNFMYDKEKSKEIAIENLELNQTALIDLNCNYIFSAVEIKNFNENNLSFVKFFENDISMWKIFLYRVVN